MLLKKIFKFIGKNYIIFLFVFTVIISFLLRVYGLSWDEGYHLHPDERMILIVTDRIRFFSNLDPDFFAYGSLPIYLLRFVSEIVNMFSQEEIANYYGMLYIGRYLCLLFDLGNVFLVFKIAYKLFKDKLTALFSMFFYGIAFFPIQNTHFYITDPILSFFSSLLLFSLLAYLSKNADLKIIKLLDVLKIAIIMGMILATKITGMIFAPVIFLVFLFKSLDVKTKRINWKKLLFQVLFFCLATVTTFFIFMPYALLSWEKYFVDISQQFKMNSDAYIFPYTLQYVGTTAYWYYLRNIFLWGLGPFISILVIIGIYSILSRLVQTIKQKKIKLKKLQIIILFFAFFFYSVYFIVIGRSAVKFMRYMMVLYPFFAVLAGYGFSYLVKTSRFEARENRNSFYSVVDNLKFCFAFLILSFASLWSLCFVNIYSQKHTRIQASQWILENISEGSSLGIEHWDDRLPLDQSERYNIVDLTLYDRPDDEFKWQQMDEKLEDIDYIVIASNRLYTPLQKLSDCQKYKECYPKTAQYYEDLFSNKRGFQLIKTFSVIPFFKVPFTNIVFEIDDQSADESFTVYDHPKIFIFESDRLNGNY